MTTLAESTIAKCSERSIRRPCSGCGRTDLWWGHANEGTGHGYCRKHSIKVDFVLIEADGTRHACKSERPIIDQPGPDETHTEPTSEPTPWRDMTPVPTSPVPSNGSGPVDVNSVADAFTRLLANAVSPEQVAAVVDSKMGAFRDDMLETVGSVISDAKQALLVPVKVEVTRNDMTVKTIDSAHRALPDVIKATTALRPFGMSVLLVGPMGTGKSTLASQVAEALDLEFRMMAVGPQTSKSDVMGYMTADGTYVPSLFRLAYEHGGVWLFDELDAAHPGVMTIINAALSNGHAAFPDGMVKRHPDCLILAAANTYGRGPDRMYVGRQALDAATLNRFVTIEMAVDEPLETSLAYATGVESMVADRVLRYVRALRKSAQDQKVAVGFSPRNSVAACALLKAGFSTAMVLDSAIRQGISDQDWSKVSRDVTPLTI